jgi:hypothetical protein
LSRCKPFFTRRVRQTFPRGPKFNRAHRLHESREGLWMTPNTNNNFDEGLRSPSWEKLPELASFISAFSVSASIRDCNIAFSHISQHLREQSFSAPWRVLSCRTSDRYIRAAGALNTPSTCVYLQSLQEGARLSNWAELGKRCPVYGELGAEAGTARCGARGLGVKFCLVHRLHRHTLPTISSTC